MPPLASVLVRTGLALKLSQIKRAASSYMRDRTEQGQSIAVSYAVAAGLYAAAGIFLITTLLVGATALFRWVEIRYGLFQAFGATGGLLLVLAIICAVLASSRLKRPSKSFPSLGSRLRVAVNATPSKHDGAKSQVANRDRAAPAEFKPSTRPAKSSAGSFKSGSPTTGSGPVKAGLLLAATLAGWALVRRRAQGQLQSQPSPTPRPPGKATA